MKTTNPTWAFFGTSTFSVIILEQLKARGFMPKLIVTVEDKPKGRKLILTPPDTKIWAEKEGIKLLQLKTLRKPESLESIKSFGDEGFDLFIVASYGKIIPQEILDIPKLGTLNVHPSLLPKLRGPSPIQSAILKENETGVSIMRLDALMDHGPILAQKKIDMEWPPYADELEKKLAEFGGSMLADLLPDFIEQKTVEKEQDHTKATLCEKIQKADGQINMDDPPEINLRKIKAFTIWPGAFFFISEKRIIIKSAHIEDNKLVIERIIPEGRKEMNYSDFIRGKN